MALNDDPAPIPGAQPAPMAPVGPAPPYHVLEAVLPSEDLDRLLTWALSARDALSPSTVASGVNQELRLSSSLTIDRGNPWRPYLEERVREWLPELFRRLSLKPFTPGHIELELAAYNDGAFFLPHIDTLAGGGKGSYRRLSGVFYFHREPKGFEDGQLRLHRFGSSRGREEGYIDIEPRQNTFVFFPSMVRHEVLPVVCRSRRFEDSRFSINCWIHV